jgi:hypothetical protein
MVSLQKSAFVLNEKHNKSPCSLFKLIAVLTAEPVLFAGQHATSMDKNERLHAQYPRKRGVDKAIPVL